METCHSNVHLFIYRMRDTSIFVMGDRIGDVLAFVIKGDVSREKRVSFLPLIEPVPLLGDVGTSHFFRSKTIVLERVSDLSPI
jgi:hypothetical protein